MSQDISKIEITHIPSRATFEAFLLSGNSDNETKINKFLTGEEPLKVYRFYSEEGNSFSQVYMLGKGLGPDCAISILASTTVENIIIVPVPGFANVSGYCNPIY